LTAMLVSACSEEFISFHFLQNAKQENSFLLFSVMNRVCVLCSSITVE
jgi:hypothetical protein